MLKKTTGVGLLVALLALAGLAAAEPLALVAGEGGGQAAGQVTGDYHADASGAVDEADRVQGDLHERAATDVRNANEAATDAKWSAYENASEIEPPQQPECECDEVFNQLEQKGTMSAWHADEVEKAADLESEYVDAGADLSASGQANAWFSDLFTGAEDLYNQAKGLVGFETNADRQAKVVAEQTLHAEDEVRGEVVDTVTQGHELPDADPSVEGTLGAEHATEVASSAVGNGQVGLP